MQNAVIGFPRVGNLKLSEIDTYFSMVRGYQGDVGDVPSLATKNGFIQTIITLFLNRNTDENCTDRSIYIYNACPI